MGTKLSPRNRQTLGLLLNGKSEKEAARELKISIHTVHVYVKMIYARHGVCSRAELLAKFLKLIAEPGELERVIESA